MANKRDDMSIAGEGLTVTIAGKEYKKRSLTLGDFAELESFIKSQRIKALHDALEDGKPDRSIIVGTQVIKNPEYDDWLEQKTKLTIGVAQVAITGAELDTASDTLSGIRFLFQHVLDGNTLPLGGIDELITPDNMAEFNTLLREDEAIAEEDDESPPEPEETNG